MKASRFVATFYDLKCPVTKVCEPLDELARVAAVRPDKGETPKLPSDLLENQFRPVSVLNVRWMHHDRQDQAQRVDEQMTFSPLHLFARVVATRPWGFRGFHRLTIQDGGRRRGIAPLLLPNITPQRVVDPLPGTVLAPTVEIAVGGAPVLVGFRKQSPLTAGARDEENAIHDTPHVHASIRAIGGLEGNQRRMIYHCSSVMSVG